MEGYKIRMYKEYHELKARHRRLRRIIAKAEAGTLPFEAKTPVTLMKQQAAAMDVYMKVLETRAELEGLDLDGVIPWEW